MKSMILNFFSQHRVAALVVGGVAVLIVVAIFAGIRAALRQKKAAAEARRIRAERERDEAEKLSYFFTKR